MDRHPSRIDRRYTCWRHHGNLFGAVLPNMPEKGRLTGSGLPREENIPGTLSHELYRDPEHFIADIVLHSQSAKLTQAFQYTRLVQKMAINGPIPYI